MILPRPPVQYSAADQAQLRSALQEEDLKNQKRGAPVLLRSPNGSLWKLSVDDSGTLSAVAA